MRLALFFVAALAAAQQPDTPTFSTTVATFGTTVVVPGGLTGEIYALRPGTRSLPDFRKLEPLGKIYTRQLWVPPREFSEGFPGVTNRIEWFAIDFTGRFYIAEPGVYRFQIQSDDGSKLYIDGKVRINADGVGWLSGSANVHLTGGIHQIRVSYFQGPRYHLYLMLGVAGPHDKAFRPFNTDDFRPPSDLDAWTYAVPEDLAADPRRKLGAITVSEPARPSLANAVAKPPNPIVPLSVRVISGGQSVPGLTAADFVVREAGAVQPLTRAEFGAQPLDIEILIDTASGLNPLREDLARAVGAALRELRPDDRIGLFEFSDHLVERLPLTHDRSRVQTALFAGDSSPSGRRLRSAIGTDPTLHDAIQIAEAAKELNTPLALAAESLRAHAPPDAARAIVLVTDNRGIKGTPDTATRDALWRANVTVCGILARSPETAPAAEGAADVRAFIQATGGQIFDPNAARNALVSAFTSLRDRYFLAYPATAGQPKTIRPVSVELSPGAAARFPAAHVLVRTAYVVGE